MVAAQRPQGRCAGTPRSAVRRRSPAVPPAQRLIKVSACIGDVVQTALRIFLQTSAEQPVDACRRRCVGAALQSGSLSEDRRHGLRHGLAGKRDAAPVSIS